jgi:hypothetical protein
MEDSNCENLTYSEVLGRPDYPDGWPLQCGHTIVIRYRKKDDQVTPEQVA